jgi:hypothetical protein
MKMNKKILISLILVSSSFLSACTEQESNSQTTDLECLDYKSDIDEKLETNSQALKSDNADFCKYLIEVNKEDLQKKREEQIEFEKYMDSLFPSDEKGEKQDNSKE